MATVVGTVPGPWNNLPEWNDPARRQIDFAAHYNAEQSAVDELVLTSDALPEGNVVGFIVSFPVGDGCALYRVKKTSPLQLEHIPALDAWHADSITIRGLRLSDVRNQQRRAKILSGLFRGKNAR